MSVKMTLLKNVIREKCPNCGEGTVFEDRGSLLKLRLPKMKQECSVCHHKFKKEPGFFFGAMYVSYGLAVAELIIAFLIFRMTGLPAIQFFPVVIALLVILSMFNYRLSRLIWMAMFSSSK